MIRTYLLPKPLFNTYLSSEDRSQIIMGNLITAIENERNSFSLSLF